MFRCQNNRLKEKINTFAQDFKKKLLGKNNGIKMIAIEYEKKHYVSIKFTMALQ